MCSGKPSLHKPNVRAAVKAGFSSIRFTAGHYSLLEKHTSILVGISGGIDSLVLLSLLLDYNDKYRQKWDIKAAHIDAGFPGWDPDLLHRHLKAKNIHTTTVRTTIHKKIENAMDKCFICSRERRKTLIEIAEGLDVFKIALAHHQEDVVETLLLNMLYTGRMATILPKQSILRGRFSFVRPIYFLNKKSIVDIGRAYALKDFGNACPYYRDSRRERIRESLRRIQTRNPDVYTNIFRSIFNLNKQYMPG